MNKVDVGLSIIASILSIYSVVVATKSKNEVKKIKGKIKSGDNSLNVIGSDNATSYDKR